MIVSIDELKKLQLQQWSIRNISIVAHIDHGKTTLSDCLIASNGLIHPRMVGELRYLDSREDEQLRGITIKSSSISLLHRIQSDSYSSKDTKQGIGQEAEPMISKYLINLIDSPGHIDFCSEISTALRLTDGCIVIVDAVEGVCIQTHAVLRKAWEEKVIPCLVINKIDRLIVMLNMSAMEVYERLKEIITHVNLIMSTFESERYLSEANSILATESAREQMLESQIKGFYEDEQNELEDFFDPCKGNVAFSCAIDGWSFRIEQFAKLYASKLGAKLKSLEKALWGDYHFQAKTKSVIKIKHVQNNKQKPMFVQFILEPLFNVYDTLRPGADYKSILRKIIKSQGLEGISDRILETTDPKKLIKLVMSEWLPLSSAVLGMVVEHLPDPIISSKKRMKYLLPSIQLSVSICNDYLMTIFDNIRTSLETSRSQFSDPLVIFVSKMIAVNQSWLPRESKVRAKAEHKGNVFLAFGRVFSGVVKKGMRVHIINSSYDPSYPISKYRKTAVIGELFLMMGRGLDLLDEVPSGNVLAISGLDEVIAKSATVSSSPLCLPLSPMTFQADPIVRVAIEPALPSQLDDLEKGLYLLAKADPFVEVNVTTGGEHVLGAAGEVHLEICLKDLIERFAGIQIRVSPPIVTFYETVLRLGEEKDNGGSENLQPSIKERKVICTSTPTGVCSLRIKAHALTDKVSGILEESSEILNSAFNNKDINAVSELKSRMRGIIEDEETPNDVKNMLKRAWVFGPKNIGPNILMINSNTESLFDISSKSSILYYMDKKQNIAKLLNKHKISSTTIIQKQMEKKDIGYQNGIDADMELQSLSEEEGEGGGGGGGGGEGEGEAPKKFIYLKFLNPLAANIMGLAELNDDYDEENELLSSNIRRSIESGIITGFQMASAAGPLCDESLWGVAFEIEVCVCVNDNEKSLKQSLGEDVFGPFTGQVMTVANAAFRAAVIESHPRLVESYYLCEISAISESLSGVYSVLSKRRSRILREELQEGSNTFTIHAYLPVEASFGLAGELRKKTSGAASASLMLSHRERLQVDPFFVPTTEEELEEYGEEARLEMNLAQKLIITVRKRKGLPVMEKIVENATKQRTLARKV